MAKKVYWSRSESSCITYRFVVVVFEALKLLNILSMIVYVLLLNLSLVLKNPITFFVIMVVSDGELETKENKIQTKEQIGHLH